MGLSADAIAVDSSSVSIDKVDIIIWVFFCFFFFNLIFFINVKTGFLYTLYILLFTKKRYVFFFALSCRKEWEYSVKNLVICHVE